ncbi:MAG: hypothetical protein COA39_001970 [Sulfurimonas sp.]|nr:hypothetical protein [Sulfurimonas sp.]
MKYSILLLPMINVFASDLFMDLSMAKCLGQVEVESVTMDQMSGAGIEGSSSIYQIGVSVGYSINLTDTIVTEPALGFSIIDGFDPIASVAQIYSLEVPLLYKYKTIKSGVFIKYNYLSGINVRNADYTATLDDKQSYSLGLKTIIETRNINVIFAYEYLLDAAYDEYKKTSTGYTDTQVNLGGSYLSLGIRFKF